MHYILYILRCSDSTFYTGITTDIEKRISQHNGTLPGGAKYTKGRSPVELLYQESYENRSEATKRELQIKKLSRERKICLIHEMKL